MLKIMSQWPTVQCSKFKRNELQYNEIWSVFNLIDREITKVTEHTFKTFF